MTRPTLHVTNFASRKLHHGQVFTIMARPRHFETGEGRVGALVPPVPLLERVQRHVITIEDYLAQLEESWRRDLQGLEPGVLRYSVWEDGVPSHVRPVHLVPADSTLCCACSRAKAAAGHCHRVTAARLLVEVGWRVVLDGEEVSP